MKRLMCLFAASVMTFAGVIVAEAVPVDFTFHSNITSSSIAGVSAGDTVTVNLLADNGGSDLISQTWKIEDIISGSLSAGSYWQTYSDGWFSLPSWVAFVTDGTGDLVSSVFYGTTYSSNHQDPFGTGPPVYLANGTFFDYYNNFADYFPNLSASPSYWTVSVSPVPEPSTVMLLGSGLVGLVGYGRRRLKK